MYTATLTSKGQITVPKPIRERLNIIPGDRVYFSKPPDKSINFKKLEYPLNLCGSGFPAAISVAQFF